MNDFTLHNKTIIITGATSGIGRKIVEYVVQAGAQVIATGRDKIALEEIQKEFPTAVLAIFSLDLTNEEEVAHLAETIPSIDGMVYSAGMVNSFPIRYLTTNKLMETFSINFFGAVELVAKLDKKKKLNKGASLVFMSSVSAMHPHKGGTAYSASKAALEAFVKVVALEYAHRAIRANAISPAMVKTPLYEKARELASADSMDEHLSHYLLGIGETTDVANAAVYLLSPASKWVTGTTITLDGGLLLGY